MGSALPWLCQHRPHSPASAPVLTWGFPRGFVPHFQLRLVPRVHHPFPAQARAQGPSPVSSLCPGSIPRFQLVPRVHPPFPARAQGPSRCPQHPSAHSAALLSGLSQLQPGSSSPIKLMAPTCLAPDEAVLANEMTKPALRAGLRGRGSCAARGQPRTLGYRYLLCNCSPSLTHSHLCQPPWGTAPSAGAVLSTGPRCSACGPSLGHLTRMEPFPPPRAPRSAAAAWEQPRGSSSSGAGPGRVMLSPVPRWVPEGCRDAAHSVCSVWALSWGCAEPGISQPPAEPGWPGALPAPALPTGLITAKPTP